MAEPSDNIIRFTLKNAKAPERLKTLAEECQEWELPLHDIFCMSCAVDQIIETAIAENHAPMTGHPEYKFLPQEKVEQILFATDHLKKMIGSFKEKYSEAVERSCV